MDEAVLPPPETQSASKGLALALICCAQLLLQLDFSIVNVALSTMQSQLGFSPVMLQWVMTGYALSYGSLLLIGGRIGDLFGHRRVMIVGLVVFAITSLTGGLAVEPTMLIVSRIAQGASAALVAPNVLAILTSIFTTQSERTSSLSTLQASNTGGATAGIVLGGILVQYFGWRSVLLVNPPIIVVLVALMLRYLPKTAPNSAKRSLDVAGAALATASICALVYGMNMAEQQGFAAILPVTMLVASLVLGAGFIVNEFYVREPMLPLAIFRDDARCGALVVAFLAGCVLSGYVYFAALYLQQVLGYSALATGLGLLPSTLTSMFMSFFISRRLVPKLGTRRMLMLSLPLMVLGQFWLSRITADGTYVINLLPGLVLTAAALGLSFPTVSVAVTSGIEPHLRGVAGGLFVTAQQTGLAVGLAVLATIAAARTNSTGGSLVAGFSLSFLVASGIALFAFVLAQILIKPKRV